MMHECALCEIGERGRDASTFSGPRTCCLPLSDEPKKPFRRLKRKQILRARVYALTLSFATFAVSSKNRKALHARGHPSCT